MKKLFLFTFALIFLTTFVMAAPPSQTNVNTATGVQIFHPEFETVKVDQHFNLSIHTTNISDGKLIITPNCTLEIENHTGDILLEVNFTKATNLHYYYLAEGNFTKTGMYAYTIFCEDVLIGGAVEGLFEITASGTDNANNFMWVILLLGFGIVLLGYILEDGWITILGSFALYFDGIYIILNGINGIQDLVTTIAMGTIILGVGIYISARAAIELLGK